MTLSNVADFSPFGIFVVIRISQKNDRNRLEICKFHKPFVTWVATVPCIGEVWPLLNSTVSSHMQGIPCYNDPIAGVRSCCRVGLLKTEIYFWGFFCCLFFGFMLLNRKLRFAFDLLLRALETLLSKLGKNFGLWKKNKKKQADKFNVSSL